MKIPARRTITVSVAVIALVMAAAGLALTRGVRGSRQRPVDSVILISIDTLRADHLGFMGYQRPTSPNLDRLAAESVVFRQAYSQAPETLPSHATMFTSLYPSDHAAHVTTRTPLGDDFVTLAEILQERGYRTAAFVAGGQVGDPWNLDQGFETYDVSSVCSYDGWVPDDLAGILWRALTWIKQNRDKPFFCFVHSYVVHVPYMPRPPYDRMFDEGYTGPLPFRITDELEKINRERHYPSDPDVKHIVSLYDGEIRYMDRMIGEFLGHVEDMGLRNRTMIAFTSDHGEEFAEHGLVGEHCHSLYDELLHVPLFFRVPGSNPGVIDQPARLLDLTPTILGVLGIETADMPFGGVNLLGGDLQSGGDLPVFSEICYTKGYRASLLRNGLKIIAWSPERYELYRVSEDPQEQRDLAAFLGDEIEPLRTELIDFVQERQELDMRRAAPTELEPEDEAPLRALGYIR